MAVLAEGVRARVNARSRTRSFVFFAVTSVTVDGIENTGLRVKYAPGKGFNQLNFN